MNQKLSPQTRGCPLVHLGHSSSAPEDSPPHDYYTSNSTSNNTSLAENYYQQANQRRNNGNDLDFSSLSLVSGGDNYWGETPSWSPANYFIMGKSSPSLDQGYHTLAFNTTSTNNNPGPASNYWPQPLGIHGNKGKKHFGNASFFDRLSDVLVLRIFAHLTSLDLSTCAMVCRRFNILAWTPSLWRSVRLEGEQIKGDRAVRSIVRQLCNLQECTSIERVHVTYGCKVTDKSLLQIARRCPDLTHLQLHGCTAVTNNALFELATRCNHLQHLDVTGGVKISCISSDTPSNLQLQYLDLTDCTALQDGGLRVIVQNCPQLTHLYLRRCVQITDSGLKFVPSFCPDLKELSVSDCVNITDFGLYELGKLGAVLRYLSVAKCHQVSDAGLKVIAKRCYKLRYLNARGCEAVSDDAIVVLARSCTRLGALDVGKCDVSDAGLRALAESCPNLKKLSVRSCDLVTDRGVQCVAYYCRGLQQLNIQDCQISLEGYRAVKRYCKRCVIEHTNPGFF